MSQAGPNGRDRPRWSAGGHPFAEVPPWLIAGLPCRSVCVIVGPPLSDSVPRRGSVLVRSVGLANPHDAPLSRLYPAVSAGAAPTQLVPEAAPATIVPVSRRSGHDSDRSGELPLMVVYPTVPPPQA